MTRPAIRNLRSLLLALLLTAAVAQAPSPPPYTDSEAYRVYSAVIGEWPSDANAKRILIRQQTVPFQMCLKPRDKFVKIMEPAIDDWIAQNQHLWTLERKFSTDKPYDLIPSAELTGFFAADLEEGWKKFYRRHPDASGFDEFSAVGFNRDHNIAIVYAAEKCGPKCGHGSFYVMQKKRDHWETMLWSGQGCTWSL
jgi:hypothetical protein